MPVRAHHRGGKKIAPPASNSAAKFAAVETRAAKAIRSMKDASTWKGIAGWFIPGLAGPSGVGGAALSYATAFSPFTSAQNGFDIFQQATNPTGNNAGNGMPAGQSTVNNFLSQQKQPFNVIGPEYSGVYVTESLADIVGSFISAFYENVIAQLKVNNNASFWQPLLTLPPGMRPDRRGATTISSSTLITEGIGSLSPNASMFKHNENYYWDDKKTLSFLLSPTPALSAFIQSLTTQIMPAWGANILYVGIGFQLREVGTLV